MTIRNATESTEPAAPASAPSRLVQLLSLGAVLVYGFEIVCIAAQLALRSGYSTSLEHHALNIALGGLLLAAAIGVGYRHRLEREVRVLKEVERKLERSREEQARQLATLRESERRLRESETKFRDIFDAALGAIAINDLETGTYVEVNDEFVRDTGFTREDAVGRTPMELGIWTNLEEIRKVFQSLTKDREVRDVQLDYRTKSGESRTCLLSASIREIGGRPCTLTVARDVSDILEAHKKVEESEAKFRDTFNAALGIITISDVNSGNYLEVNNEFLHFTGYSRDEVIGRTPWDLGVWSDAGEIQRLSEVIFRSGEVRDLEVNLRSRTGRTATCLLSAVIMEIGGRSCTLTMARDISEIREAQRKAQQSEATLRKIFDANVDSIAITDAETLRYVEVNEAFVRASGFRKGEVIGRTSGELGVWWESRDRDQFHSLIQRDGAVRNMEATFRLRDGATMPSLVSAVVLELNGRRCVLSIARDIRERKQFERELIDAREAALAASHAKSEFLSSMSHEIRTPMNAILGMSDVLAETDLTSEQRRYLEVVTGNGNSLLALINDILDLAKVESGRLAFEHVVFDLGDVLEKCADTLGLRAAEKQLTLSMRVAVGTPTTLVGDPLRLGQVLINLIGNAIKFTDTGEVKVTIEGERVSKSDARLRFAVADTGIGIPAGQLESLFDPFTQADSSTTRRYGGSGLGLAIVKRLVTLMGGEVAAESQIDEGSTFRFTAQFELPNATGARLSNPPSGESAAPSSSGAPLPIVDRPLRILLADDSDDNRALVRTYLSRTGYLLDEVRDGRAAIEKFSENSASQPYDLVLMDIQMPEIDGYLATRAIRNWEREHRRRRTPIVALTASVLEEAVRRTLEAGCDAHVSKPVKRRTLLQAVHDAVADADRAASNP